MLLELLVLLALVAAITLVAALGEGGHETGGRRADVRTSAQDPSRVSPIRSNR
jgi:hypothetical protein